MPSDTRSVEAQKNPAGSLPGLEHAARISATRGVIVERQVGENCLTTPFPPCRRDTGNGLLLKLTAHCAESSASTPYAARRRSALNRRMARRIRHIPPPSRSIALHFGMPSGTLVWRCRRHDERSCVQCNVFRQPANELRDARLRYHRPEPATSTYSCELPGTATFA